MGKRVKVNFLLSPLNICIRIHVTIKNEDSEITEKIFYRGEKIGKTVARRHTQGIPKQYDMLDID